MMQGQQPAPNRPPPGMLAGGPQMPTAEDLMARIRAMPGETPGAMPPGQGMQPQSGAEAVDLQRDAQSAEALMSTGLQFAAGGPVSGAVSRVAPPIMRGLSAMLRSAPGRAALGGGAVTAASSETSPTAQADKQDPRVSKIGDIERKIATERAAMEKALLAQKTKSGREAIAQPYNTRITALQGEIDKLETELRGDASRKRDADKTLNELFPGANLASLLIGSGIGGKIGHSAAKAGVSRFNEKIKDVNNRWAGAAQRAEANPHGSMARDQAMIQSQELQRAFDALQKRGPKYTSATPMLATGAGLEIGLNAPVAIDRFVRSEPGSPLRDRMNDTMTSPWEMVPRVLGPAVTGAAGGKLIGINQRSRRVDPTGYHAETAAQSRAAPPIPLQSTTSQSLPPAGTPALPSPSSPPDPGLASLSTILRGQPPAGPTAPPRPTAEPPPPPMPRSSQPRNPRGAVDEDGNRIGGRWVRNED